MKHIKFTILVLILLMPISAFTETEGWREVCQWINSGQGMLSGGCKTEKDAMGAAKIYKLLSSSDTPKWKLDAIGECIKRERTEKGTKSNYLLYLRCQAGKY